DMDGVPWQNLHHGLGRPAIVPGTEFLVVDLPATGLVLAQHTLAVHGSQADSIREAPDGQDPRKASTHLVVLQGFSEPQFQALLADMRRLYQDIQVLDEDSKARRWVVRNRFKMDDIQAKQLLLLNRAETEFGLYWTHIYEGRFQLRAEVRAHERAQFDLERLKEVFRQAGVPAEVRLQELGAGDIAVSRFLRDLLVRFAPAPKAVKRTPRSPGTS
ncbi:MAG: hypothetical protein QOJ26_851, partial [Thermoplasmata archaeon]|nr:hypothetical protein [Thermoplasmata archaeon]